MVKSEKLKLLVSLHETFIYVLRSKGVSFSIPSKSVIWSPEQLVIIAFVLDKSSPVSLSILQEEVVDTNTFAFSILLYGFELLQLLTDSLFLLVVVPSVGDFP